MKHTWRKVKGKVIFRGKHIGTIYSDEVIFPSGKKGNYEYLKRDPAVAIVPVTNKGKVVLVGQYRYSVSKFSWEIPEGQVDKGYTSLRAAKKELNEEAGLRAKSWKYLGKFVLGTGGYSQHLYVYLAKNLYPGKQEPEVSGEILEVKEVTIKELNKMVRGGKIFEGPTLAALYLAKDYLR